MIAALLLLACKAPTEVVPPAPSTASGLLGDHPLNPFPVGALHFQDGAFSMDSADFGITAGQTQLPWDRLGFRTGFSPGQTSVVVLESVDTSVLPTWSAPTPDTGSVRLYDLDSGTWLPTFAEIDAHPRATPNTLLIRPLQALAIGHEIAVVITTAVTPRPARFDALLSSEPPEDLAAHASDFQSLVQTLDGAGLPADDIALAWSFPIGDGTAPTRSVWSQAGSDQWTLDDVRDETEATAPFTYRAARGSFTVPQFLVEDLSLNIDGTTGAVTADGTTEAYLYVHVPLSVADAPVGTVPVMLFGHGIFATPDLYLNEADDPSSLNRLCEEGGFIAVATNWRGLTTPDLGGTIAVSQDFGRMHELTDRLVQAQGNVTGLIDLLRNSGFYDDPVFQGRQGQRLPSDELVYYGISLGGIEGTVLQASQPDLDRAVLHVAGSTWSTMLERSSNWTQFETILETSVPEALDRQRLYAASQLWWDSVDPIAFTPDLQDRDFLYQVSVGDEQVPNLTSYALARSISLPLQEPSVNPVYGLTSTSAASSRGLVQFDPETALPPETNRPAPVTKAHDRPRNFGGTLQQIRTYLADGTIQPACGTAPCTYTQPEP